MTETGKTATPTAAEWNRRHQVGTPVLVEVAASGVLGGTATVATVTASEAWHAGSGRAFVRIALLRQTVPLDRVRPATAAAGQSVGAP